MRNHIIIVVCLLLMPFLALAKSSGDEAPVVIVSSYNPEVKNISDNLHEFTKEFTERGRKNPLVLENMHCLNLTECMEWKDRLWGLLEKYYENGSSPAAIVLLGTEASSTFLSLDQECLKSTPVVLGMRSDNYILLPDEETNLVKWRPECHYLTEENTDFNIIGGFVYQYDISRNIDIIRHISPATKTVAFISDNSFGGVTMYSHFSNTIKAFPELRAWYLDGRRMSLQDVNDALSHLDPESSAILIGTWRIDKTNIYALSNTTYALAQSNPTVPAVSLSSVGMGHWAVGGYDPDYCIQGGMMAECLGKYLKSGVKQGITVIPSSYTFDQEKVDKFNVDLKYFDKVDLVNKKQSFIRENLSIILLTVAIIAVLGALLVITGIALRRSVQFQKKLEQRSAELVEERDRAEQASAMKSNFIANISHEIRTPLNAIVGFTQILIAPGVEVSEDEKEEFGSAIMMNSSTLLHLINDILDLSKMDVNKMTFNIQKVDIVKIVRLSVASAQTSVKEGVEILFNTSVSELLVEVDKERMSQVMANLLSNAKKCTESGSITANIDYKEGDEEVRVSVTDTGIGIPPEMAEKVFERFKKLNNYVQGTGLGLPISRSIIEHFGGKIWVDTEYTGGARFIFTLPVR